jgi:SAM-dependent methyltransferase
MNRPGWWLDELQYAGEEHLDPEYVAAYDRKAATDPSEDLTLLRSLGMNEQSVVVDLGAGTGTFALAAAPLCSRVVAADVSPTMLTVMREQAAQQNLTNVEIVQAGFLSYEHQGDAPGFVYSRNALHHLPDFWKAIALRRIHDMLQPGGILRLHDLVYSFEPHEAEPIIESWLANAAASPEDGWTRPELETHIRSEHSTFAWLLEPMLERAGFEIGEATYSPTRKTYATYTCVRRG